MSGDNVFEDNLHVVFVFLDIPDTGENSNLNHNNVNMNTLQESRNRRFNSLDDFIGEQLVAHYSNPSKILRIALFCHESSLSSG